MSRQGTVNRLRVLEQKTCNKDHRYDYLPKFYNRCKKIAEDLRKQNLPEEDLSTRDLCVLAMDWDNEYDLFRVMRFVVILRKEFGSQFQEHDDTDEFREKLIPMLQARGVSTAENTRMPSDMGRIPGGEDRDVMNELSRYLAYSVDNSEYAILWKDHERV